MHFLTVTIVILIVLPLLYGITVSPGYERDKIIDITSKRSSFTKTNLNNTERYRRLIPYMTYYVPTNDHIPQNQAYSYVPRQQVAQQKQLYQQRPQPQVQQIQNHYILHPQKQIPQQQQQQQQQQEQIKRPIISYNSNNNNNNNNYPTYKQQIQTILYNSQPQQQNPPYESHIQPNQQQTIPQRVIESEHIKYQPQQQSNSKITPFLPSNKVPGQFRPIIYNNHQNHNIVLPSIGNINVNQHQNNVIHQQQQQQQEQNQKHQIDVIKSTPQPFIINYNDEESEKKYLTYLQTQNFAQYVQSTSKPPLQLNSPQPISRINNNNHNNNDPIIYQVKHLSTPANDVINYHNDNRDDDEYYQHENNNQFQLKQINNQQKYQQLPDYSIDPNDGYDIKVPLNQQRIKSTQQRPTISQKRKYNGYNTLHAGVTLSPPVTVTPLPSSTPQLYKYEPNIDISYDTDNDNDDDDDADDHRGDNVVNILQNNKKYSTVTTLPQRQHLTETTQIQPPTLTTYQPPIVIVNPPVKHFYNPYENIPNTRKPSYLQYQYQSVTKNPISTTTSAPTIIHKEIIASPENSHHSSVMPEFSSSSLTDILKKLQDTNHLPKNLTPDNIDESIKTLVRILTNLKQSQNVADIPSQHHQDEYEYDYNNSESEEPTAPLVEPAGPNNGRPGIDYPALAEIPQTKFNCKEQRYKGFFGDPETNCQVWHYCDLNGGQSSFLCPNGTIFNQLALTCDWWFNVKCATTAQLYVLNERLYKYILPFTPKFPQDYSGPLVDKYLALKFQEMEEKMRRQKLKGGKDQSPTDINEKNIVKEEESNDNSNIGDNNDSDGDNDNDNDDSGNKTNVYENVNGNIDSSSAADEEIDDEGQRHNIDSAVQFPAIIPIDQQYYLNSNDNNNNYNNENSLHSTTTTESYDYKHIPNSIQYLTTTQIPPLKLSTITDAPLSSSSISSLTSTQAPPQQLSSTIVPYKHQNHNNQPIKKPQPIVEVESEKVEVIEIKSDGSTGHLIPGHQYIDDDDGDD